MTQKIEIERVLNKLEEYFSKKDYSGAKKHLLYWLNESEILGDMRGKLAVSNELIGLSRKMSEKENAFLYTDTALDALRSLDAEDNIGAGTTYINIATSYKAFGKLELSLSFFEKAKKIYLSSLSSSDPRLGGLYNNMALTLADLGRFKEAYMYFSKAIEIMEKSERGELEMAITYLNIASAKEVELGLLAADEEISVLLEKAENMLELYKKSNDGYYAFVCEKCASVFGYYGRFVYEKELLERVKLIYERN